MEGAPLPSKPDFRGFFHRLLSHEPTQRRVFLKLWHSPYPIVPKRHARLADVFVEFIGDILYEAVEFKLRQDHFCLFGRGKQGLGFQLRWLKKKQRDFLVYSVFAHRHALFKSIKRFENNQFDLSGFVHDPQQQQKEHPYERICDPMWQRELVRDFVWLVISKREGHMTLELIAALQEMMLSHPMGRKDIFLASLHAGLQGHCNVREVLCWGNETYDVHSEEDWQKRIQPPPGQIGAIENARYIRSTCTVINYTFTPRDGCYASWINVVTAEGAHLIYWFVTGVCDPTLQKHAYALRYELGTVRTCYLSVDRWVWALNETLVPFIMFIVCFSVAGAALLGLIVIAIALKRRAKKASAITPTTTTTTTTAVASDSMHVELVESNSDFS